MSMSSFTSHFYLNNTGRVTPYIAGLGIDTMLLPNELRFFEELPESRDYVFSILST